MYVPAAFAVTDIAKLHDFIERNSFGLLVSQVDGRPFASHLPFLLERRAGPNGMLVGHVARANPQWQEAQGKSALAVFSGPHAYISPTWYESDQVVPTWNYVSVHASGRLQITDDVPTLVQIVERSIKFYEEGMQQPWTFDESTTFAKRMLAQIVGFRLEIETLEGKWKLNQNHPVERRKKVMHILELSSDMHLQAVAALMRETLADQAGE
jgi:transcriptional regulator